MAWVAADRSQDEWIYNSKPYRDNVSEDESWKIRVGGAVELPKGSIEKLIGRKLTWEDEPVELKGS